MRKEFPMTRDTRYLCLRQHSISSTDVVDSTTFAQVSAPPTRPSMEAEITISIAQPPAEVVNQR
jgi:hypothetical protein